jgi:hypothetical protein
MQIANLCRCGDTWETDSKKHFEVVVPLYKSRNEISSLINFIIEMDKLIPCKVNAAFVIDGDLDETEKALLDSLTKVTFNWRVITLSRNFGVGPALMAGFNTGNACITTAFGSDLQEPMEVFIEFLKRLSNPDVHLVLGARRKRGDSLLTKFFAKTYWVFYKKLVNSELSSGGFDVCAFSKESRNSLVALNEKNTNITAQIDWIGYKREIIFFDRKKSLRRKSTWTFRGKVKLFFDSFYGFSSYPIKLLRDVSLTTVLVISIFFLGIISTWVIGQSKLVLSDFDLLINVYLTSLMVYAITLVGGYSVRTFDNSKNRPIYIIQKISKNK